MRTIYIGFALFCSMASVSCAYDSGYYLFGDGQEQWQKDVLAGKSAWVHQHYALAERLSLAGLEGRRKAPWVKHGAHDVTFLIMIYSAQGRYARAMEVENENYDRVKEGMSLRDICWHYRFLGDCLLAQGRYEDSLLNYQMAQSVAREIVRTQPQNSRFELIQIDPYLSQYYIQIGDFGQARQIVTPYFNYRMIGDSSPDQLPDAQNRMGIIYYYSDEFGKAESLFASASQLSANTFVPYWGFMAESRAMLGRIAARRGNYDQASQYFQSAIGALREGEKLLDKFRVEQAEVQSRIGRFQVNRGNFDAARSAYAEAIRLHLTTDTDMHPNTADAFKGLADVSVAENHLTSATVYAGQALAILEKEIVPTHPRIAPTLMALSSLNRLAGSPDDAAPFDARVETICEKPLGPWKEDFMDTAAFYAGLLRRAEKIAAADQLDRLQTRQKDRR